MNILIPHNWLLEHLDTDATPEEIQSKVSLCGPSIERIYDRKTGPVYDIEVTTNRVDSMSVQGIAREAAVILTQFGIPSQLKKKKFSFPKPSTSLPLPKVINNEQLGLRVLAVVLDTIKRTPTPQWMAEKLEDIEQNVHDSVIDITNYITHELGHPIHAFDYDAVMELGGEIHIVSAKPGKTFTTLDGVEYTTVGGEVVFENQKGDIIDLPSIKGTANSSITDKTSRVLLWIESIPAKKVRFASMTHAIRTVAAQLSEKNLDSHLADATFARGIELYQELCQATVASEVYDDYPGEITLQPVTTTLKKIDTYLGIDLELQTIVKILEDLECTVSTEQENDREKTTLIVQPPTFRPDLTMAADIVEEIARIYGYHKLPSTLMTGDIPLKKQPGVNFSLETIIKQQLAYRGWQELFTYSFVSEELATQSGYELSEHAKLQNPLTDDKVYMRRSLVPSLREAVENNSQVKEVSFFEFANVYHPQNNDIPSEVMQLTMLSNKPYGQIRSDLDAILSSQFVSDVVIIQDDFNTPVATVIAQKDNAEYELGTISKVTNELTAIVIDVAILNEASHSHPSYEAIPKTSPVVEDLTFTLKKETLIGEMFKTILAADTTIIEVTLKDIYKQNYTVSITFLDPEDNMSSERVEPIRKKIVEVVKSEFGGKLVGSV